MLKITADALHEKLYAHKDDIILNGPPNDLRGHIYISNKQQEVLKVKTLPILHSNKFVSRLGTYNALNVYCKLEPGEEKLTELWHQVHPFTAPGTYESTMQVGGENRNVKMVIQQQIEIDIQPSIFTFIGTNPGTVHTAKFTLTNLGNVPFEVPDIKHVAALDMDMMCRAIGFAIRNSGAAGYEKLLDDVSKNIQSSIPDWAKANVVECGSVLQPGQKVLIQVRITLPKNCDGQKDYSGSMRFWNKDISYNIKSYNSK